MANGSNADHTAHLAFLMYVFTACQPTQAVAAAPPANIVLADASRRYAGKNDETESEGQWSGMQSKQRGSPRFIFVPVLAARTVLAAAVPYLRAVWSLGRSNILHY